MRLSDSPVGRLRNLACYCVNVQLAELTGVLTVVRLKSTPFRPEAQHGYFRPLEMTYCVLELLFWLSLQQNNVSMTPAQPGP